MTNWESLLLTWLHDLPRGTADEVARRTRLARYASIALGRSVSEEELADGARLAEKAFARIVRIPVPEGALFPSPLDAARAGEAMELRHPLAGHPLPLVAPGEAEEGRVFDSLMQLVDGLESPRERFLVLWRLLPERMASDIDPAYMHLPADARMPDHSIWHHADTVAAMRASLEDENGMTFIGLAVGPVQRFIEAARSVRDLWSGSAILSWLMFRSMLPVIETLGPTAFVFPALRGNPMLDEWLRGEPGVGDRVPRPPVSARRTPSLPNRFLAIAPSGPDGEKARALIARCEASLRDSWRLLEEAVRAELGRRTDKAWEQWDRRWREQVEGLLEVRSVVLPETGCDEQVLADLLGARSFEDAWPDAGKVRQLAKAAGHDGYSPVNVGKWQAEVDMVARLMEAQNTVRHVPAVSGDTGNTPAKCALMGSYEQMGPDELEPSREFWEQAEGNWQIHGVRLRSRERLCAPALTKRFSVPVFLARALGLADSALRFPDSATIAAARWLEEAGVDAGTLHDERGNWNGRWLHGSSREVAAGEEPIPESVAGIMRQARASMNRPVPSYYAILAMDGDRMGEWLRGEKAPAVRDVIHPDLVPDLDQEGGGRGGLDARRPVGPAVHASISDALSRFAIGIVPDIVGRYSGTLVYAGGDDLLALLPTETALSCARAIRLAFSGAEGANGGAPEGLYRLGGRDLMTMGPGASMSAGVATVHHMEDMRSGIQAARDALHLAKSRGRDAAVLRVMRRSGERPESICSWPDLDWLEKLTKAFRLGASVRWAYAARRVAPHLSGDGMPTEAASAELRRLVDRSETETRKLLGDGNAGAAGRMVSEAWDGYRQAILRRSSDADEVDGLFEDFVVLCQSAAFLARGHDL